MAPPPLRHDLKAARFARGKLALGMIDCAVLQGWPMQVDIIEDHDGLKRLEDDWQRVYAADPEAHFFMSWTWMSNWLEKAGFKWLVLAARTDDAGSRYHGFLPLQIRVELDERTGFYNSLRMAGSYFAVYTGILCVPETEADALPALARATQALNWKTLHLDDLFMSDRRKAAFVAGFAADTFATGKIVRRRHVTSGGQDIDHDTYMYVDLPDDWETFLDTSLGPKIRRDARYFLRKTDAEDEFRITVADASTVGHDLNAFMQFWLEQWFSKGEGYARGIAANCKNMLPACFRADSLFVPVLWQGDKPIGAHIAFVDRQKRRLICFLVGRDRTIRKPPPGFVLHAYSLRWAIANGFTCYDLGTGDFAYKYSFGSKEHRVEGIKVSVRNGADHGSTLEPRALPAVLSWTRRLFDQRKFVLAAIGCRQILEVAPDHAEALGLLEQAQAMTSASDASFSEALRLHRAGKVLDATKLYVAILASDPNHFDANFMLGVACLQHGEFETAERHMGRAISINPRHQAAHNNRGNALRALKRHDEALACYLRAIALKPNFAEAYKNIGLVLTETGRESEAKAYFDKAQAIDPALKSQPRELPAAPVNQPQT